VLLPHKSFTSNLLVSVFVLSIPLDLRRSYFIMLLLQSVAPTGYSRNPQAPKLWMQQFSTCVLAKPLELRCSRCSMFLLQCLVAGVYGRKSVTSRLRHSGGVSATPRAHRQSGRIRV